MARRPNYNQQRAEVNRGKQAKQEAKRREREAAVAERRAGREEFAAPQALAPVPPPADGPAAEPMAKPRDDGKWVLFDVTYADGSRRSNRKVPAGLLGGLDGDAPARAEIEAQDQRIAEASGKPAGRILSLVRSRTA